MTTDDAVTGGDASYVEVEAEGGEAPVETVPAGTSPSADGGVFGSFDWVDVIATVVMAVAALLTAWSAFQSDQWGDTMSFSLAEASAARTEATRTYTRAGQLSQADLATFFAWLQEAQREMAVGEIDVSSGYEPEPDTLSGFLYQRFRPDFKAAMDAWLATRPFITTGAPATPFVMPEYRVAEADEAERLQDLAAEKYTAAENADANDDKYVLSTIIFAGIFLFAGLSTKMRTRLGQYLMLGMAIVLLIAGAVFLVTVPILV